MSILAFPGTEIVHHLSGIARCLACGDEWDQASNHGVIRGFECPNCGLLKGAYVGTVERHPNEPVLMCKCGCDCFTISPDNAMCINCGAQVAIKVYLDN